MAGKGAGRGFVGSAERREGVTSRRRFRFRSRWQLVAMATRRAVSRVMAESREAEALGQAGARLSSPGEHRGCPGADATWSRAGLRPQACPGSRGEPGVQDPSWPRSARGLRPRPRRGPSAQLFPQNNFHFKSVSGALACDVAGLPGLAGLPAHPSKRVPGLGKGC